MQPTHFDANMKNCPCCFIVPPHLLERLATSGDPNLATTAGRTLRLTQSLVAFRAQLSTGAPSPAAAKREGLRRQVFDCQSTNDLPGDLARTRPSTMPVPPGIFIITYLDASLSTIMGRRSFPRFISVSNMTTRSGTVSRWCMVMATA